MMKYKDKVYGPVTIKERVIIDLMNTAAMQRLKRVSQAGPVIFVSPKHEWNRFKTTRFEHSVGVFILLKKFNASLEEQITGLLHDVSHTVFSHSLDFMFDRHTQHDYHEKFYKKIIMNSEVPSILEKHDININDILDEKRFTLLEKELPDLCADRIDYFFRDMTSYFGFPKKQVNSMLAAMTTFNNEIVFVDKNLARLFAEKYIEANKLLWCNPLQASLFKFISDAVRLSISKGIIVEDDLFSTDDIVYNKLKNSNDKEISKTLNLISNLEVIEDRNNYDMHLKSKVRCTDPKIIENGKIVRLSEIDDSYKEKMETFIKETGKGFFIKIKK